MGDNAREYARGRRARRDPRADESIDGVDDRTLRHARPTLGIARARAPCYPRELETSREDRVTSARARECATARGV